MNHVHQHPAANYVRYLLLVQDDVGRKAVNESLALLGIADVDNDQYLQLLTEMADTPTNFQPWNKLHLASSRWLKGKKVYSMVHQDGAVRAVRAFFENPSMREAAERMLLGGVGYIDIAFRLRELKHDVEEQSVADYRHYFWNTDALGVGDWAYYFKQDDRGRTRVTQGGYAAALYGGPQLAMYRSGVKVEVDRKAELERVYNELVFSFQEVRSLPLSMQKVEMLSALSRGIARVDERLEAGDAALQDVLKKFEKFRVLTDQEAIPSMSDLAPTGSISDTGHTLRITEKKK